MSKKRITDVNYAESINDNDSVFINQGDILRQINKADLFNNIQSQINDLQTKLNNLRNEFDTLDNEVTELDNEVVAHTHDYLPLSGGTVSGNVYLNDGATVKAEKGIHLGGDSSAYPYIYGYSGILYIRIGDNYWSFDKDNIYKDKNPIEFSS